MAMNENIWMLLSEENHLNDRKQMKYSNNSNLIKVFELWEQNETIWMMVIE
jgi:hypothetical protein